MSEQIIRVANERGVWLMAIPMVVIVVVQALLYCRLAFRLLTKLDFQERSAGEASEQVR